MSGIKHLIINSPYEEPQRHWEYVAASKSFRLVESRREAGYLAASSNRRMVDDPGQFIGLPLVNQIRGRIAEWRAGGYAGVTGITKRLLEYWNNCEEREKIGRAHV